MCLGEGETAAGQGRKSCNCTLLHRLPSIAEPGSLLWVTRTLLEMQVIAQLLMGSHSSHMAVSQPDGLTPSLRTWPPTSTPGHITLGSRHSRERSPGWGQAYPPLLVWLSRMRKAPPGFPGSNSSSSAFSRLRPSYSHLEKKQRWGQPGGECAKMLKEPLLCLGASEFLLY